MLLQHCVQAATCHGAMLLTRMLYFTDTPDSDCNAMLGTLYTDFGVTSARFVLCLCIDVQGS